MKTDGRRIGGGTGWSLSLPMTGGDARRPPGARQAGWWGRDGRGLAAINLILSDDLGSFPSANPDALAVRRPAGGDPGPQT
jgi:hypothetical protein